MMIGVDRLDYSKGIGMRMRRLRAIPRRSIRDWRGEVTYLQITPTQPLRHPRIRRHGAADQTRRSGRINGRYGEASWTPIRYVNRAHSRTALAGLYRSSRAALVTPLRDGMNLVAKEYVAAQDPGGSGRAHPVALCRRGGRMPGARCWSIRYDQEAVAAAIDQALSMPLEERQRAPSQPGQGRCRRTTSGTGASAFIAALDACRRRSRRAADGVHRPNAAAAEMIGVAVRLLLGALLGRLFRTR